MSKVCIRTTGGYALSDENESQAMAAGCVAYGFGQDFPAGAVWIGHSTTGWTGVYREWQGPKQPTVRLARFRDFGRALKYAQRAAA